MRPKHLFLSLILLIFTLSSCESEEQRVQRQAEQEEQRIELEAERQVREAARLATLEAERIEREARETTERIAREKQEEAERLEREAEAKKARQEQMIYDKYINNSLRTGSTPYAYCYGGNSSCSSNGCSQIKVRIANHSDVIVTIKRKNKVYRHGYIRAGGSHTFEMPNGTYQVFFYYGSGWNPNKEMAQTTCGTLKGGFISDESFGKDNSQSLSNNILEYELIMQENGNFSTRPSDSNEAF
jgi:hypothetical protein